MSKNHFALTLAALLIFGTRLIAATGVPSSVALGPQAGGTISGVAKRLDNSATISGLTISLWKQNKPEDIHQKMVTTDAAGNFSFTNIADGYYYLESVGQVNVSELSYYLSVYRVQRYPENTGEFIQLTGQTMDVELIMNPGFSVSGRVVEQQTQKPIASSAISCLDSTFNGLFYKGAVTDAQGYFTIGGMDSANYYFLATGGDPRFRFPLFFEEFFRESATQGGAQVVFVNQNLNNINFTLDGIAIVGQVVQQENGLPLSGYWVRLFDENWNDVVATGTNDDGAYAFGRLQPGKYYVEATGETGDQRVFFPEYYQESATREGATLLNLTGGLAENINFTLSKGLSVSGKVTRQTDNTPVASALVQVFDENWNHLQEVSTSVSGTYNLSSLIPGTYYFVANGFVIVETEDHLWQQRFFPEYYPETDTRENAQPVALTTSLTDINFTLDPGLSISGQVKQQNTQQIIRGAKVEIRQPDGVCLRAGFTNRQGNYQLGGLTAGQYLAVATGVVSSPELGEQYLYPPEYYQESATREGATLINLNAPVSGINFTLAPGQRFTVNLREKETQNPVPEAQIIFYDENWNYLQEARTNETGTWETAGFHTGQKFYIEATGNIWWNYGNYGDWKQAYIRFFYNDAAQREQATIFTFSAENHTLTIDLETGFAMNGRVTRQDDGNPIAHARMHLLDSQWNYVTEASTNSDGNYSLRVRAGDYYVSAIGWVDWEGQYLPLFHEEFFQESPDQNGATLLHSDQGRDSVNFTLEPMNLLQGHVTQADNGESIPEPQLYAFDENWSYVQEARGNLSGEFIVAGLAPGQYYFEATGNIWWNYPTYGDWNQIYRPEYFQEAATRDAATLVDISGTLPELNFTLDEFEGFTISGKLLRQTDGDFIPRSEIIVFDSLRRQIQYFQTDEAGMYTTRKLEKGNYYLMAGGFCDANGWRKLYQTRFYPDAPDWGSAIPLLVDRNLTEINFILTEGNSIAGTIFDQNLQTPIVDAQVILLNTEWQWITERRSESNGFYQLYDLAPGAYYIQVTGKIYKNLGEYGDFVPEYFPEFYPNACRETEAVLVATDRNIDGIHFLLTNLNTLQISGDVRRFGDQQPIAALQIQLFDTNWQQVTENESAENGFYHLDGLSAGAYYLKATGYCREGDNLVQRFEPVYYPGNRDQAQARQIDLQNSLEGINLAVHTVAVNEANRLSIPETFVQEPNYPNPFNPHTRLRFGLPQKEFVEIMLYNIHGQEVITLLQSELAAGWHSVTWDGLNQSGNSVASGVYLAILRAGGLVKVQKMLLLK